MNIITIAGNIAKDAEIRAMADGTAVANFTVADNQGKDKPAIFFDCALYGKRADSLKQYLRKGQAVTITGALQQREFVDKEGNSRKAFSVRVGDVALQGAPRDAKQADTPSNKPSSGFEDMDSVPF